MHPKSLNLVWPYESTILTYMRYSRAVLRKFVCAISNFQNKFPFCVLVPFMKRQGVANIVHARCVILKMSVYSLVTAWVYGGNRDAQSRNEKEIYFVLSNNKFLGKCLYGRHPWIRLAMDCERMVEKGINFIFCLGTAYDISSMESVGNYSVVFVDGKSMPLKNFISQFLLWALAPLQIPISLREGPFYLLYAIFIFTWVSIFSYRAPTREHYYHTCALDVPNISVCFMNGSMI